MTCTAIIQAETRRGVLMVPNAALRFTPPVKPGLKSTVLVADGKHRVYVLKGGQPSPIEVKPGATDGRNTEILAGELKEGALVLTDTKDPS
jgi:HlyD family secretion protein